MTEYQAQQIRDFRLRGAGYKIIASATGLSRDIVRNYCKAHGLDGFAIEVNVNMAERIRNGQACRNCGAPLIRPHTGRPPRFCSDKCRAAWWSAHKLELREGSPACYKIKCAGCGREFISYGNRNRKYCGHDCYIRTRFYGGRQEEGTTI